VTTKVRRMRIILRDGKANNLAKNAGTSCTQSAAFAEDSDQLAELRRED